MALEGVNTKSATEELQNAAAQNTLTAIGNTQFADDAEKVLLDLGASNEQILGIINSSLDNQGKMALVQQLLAMRQQAQGMLSALIATLKDIGMNVIRNMR